MDSAGNTTRDGKRKLTLKEWRANKIREGQADPSNISANSVNDEALVVLEPTPHSPTGSFYDNLQPHHLRDSSVDDVDSLLYNSIRSSEPPIEPSNSKYVLPLQQYADISPAQYRDPCAKETLDLLRRWVLALETFTVPQIESHIEHIYGRKDALSRWKSIISSINDKEEEESIDSVLQNLETEYTQLALLPLASAPTPPPQPDFPKSPVDTIMHSPRRSSPPLDTVLHSLANFSQISATKYNDPFAKATLDLLYRWAIGLEAYTLPKIETSIHQIYGGKVILEKWQKIMYMINDVEEGQSNDAVLKILEAEYAQLTLLLIPPVIPRDTPEYEDDILMGSPIHSPIALGTAAPKSNYEVPLQRYARVSSDKYEDPFAKRTLDLLRRWALGESYTLPQAQKAIQEIYGTKISFKKWEKILAAINDSEESMNPVALDLIEHQYKLLRMIPDADPAPCPPSPASTFSRPPTPPGTALPVSRPSSPQFPHKPQIRTKEEIQANPNLLSHRKGGSNALTAFDGKCGAVLPDGQTFVTTPNMDIVLMPVIESHVTLRRHNNFAQDDPLFWPQVFHRQLAHLAVIPCERSIVPPQLRAAWYIPNDADFIPENLDSIQGLCNLSETVRFSMRALSTYLEEKVEVLPADERQGVLLQLVTNLLSVGQRLLIPSTQIRLALLLAFFQRISLELYARIQWITRWRSRVSDTMPHELDTSVIGAFTDSGEIATMLFRVGIPVWFIRPIQEVVSTRVDRVVRIIDAVGNLLPVRGTEISVDISHANPPHPTLYGGTVGSFDRYQRMGEYIRSHFETNILGNFRDARRAIPHSSQIQQPPVPSTTPSKALVSQRGTVDYDIDMLDPRLHTKPVFTKKHGAKDPGFNKFDDLQSPDMPKLLVPWRFAHETLREFWWRLPPPVLHLVVPDVTMFFDSKAALRVHLVLMWLRIRPLVLWRLGSSGVNDVPVYPSTSWRAMLEGIVGNTSLDESKKGKRRKTMWTVLTDLGTQAQVQGVAFNPENLAHSAPRWAEQVMTESNLTSRIVQEILWELNEIAFRFEILQLNKRLGPQPLANNEDAIWDAHLNFVSSCWPGFIFRPSNTNPGLSRATPQLAPRQPYLYNLFRVLQRFKEPKPYLLERPFPKPEGKDVDAYEVEIHILEENMAHFYSRLFLKTFKRPATLPRSLGNIL